MHSSLCKWVRASQLCSLKIKAVGFPWASARGLRFLATVAVHGAEGGGDCVLAPSDFYYFPTFFFFSLLTFLFFLLLHPREQMASREVIQFLIYFNLSKKKKKKQQKQTSTLIYWQGENEASHLPETEQYQYLRSASLIPSKQAVIGMLAAIFHVSLSIPTPPPPTSLLLWSYYWNISTSSMMQLSEG